MPSYLLVARDGNDEFARTVVGDQQVAAGRLEDCELVLDEPWVSRRHLIFTPTEGSLRVDNVSQNPVFINDIEMTDATLLAPGDVIAVGSFRIDVRLDIENLPVWDLVTLSSAGTQRFAGPTPIMPLMLGRARSCDIVIDVPFIGSRELGLRWRDDGVAVQDLGSRHGLRSSSSEIVQEDNGPALLVRPGDWVAVGQVTILITAPGTPIPDGEVDDVLDVEFGELLRDPRAYDGEFIRTSGIWVLGHGSSDFGGAWVRLDSVDVPEPPEGETAAFWIDATGRWRYRSKSEVERGRGFGRLGKSRGLMTVETLHHMGVAPRIFDLVPLEDPSQSHPIYIGGCLFFGTHPRCNVVLEGGALFHARIDVREETVITDLGSVSGTFVNGFSINRPTVLRAHDILEIDGRQFGLKPFDLERQFATQEVEASAAAEQPPGADALPVDEPVEDTSPVEDT